MNASATNAVTATTIADAPPKRTASYEQILKSSSIVGGAQAISLLVGMVRTKMVAVLLGPAGVGLVGLYTSAIDLVKTVAALGISSSGVREVAEAVGSQDYERIGCTIRVLRRTCWVTGFLGWGLTVALARPLSRWTFGNTDHAWPLAVLGLTLLLGSVSGGQSALIQGSRRIGDLARLQIIGVVVGTVNSIALYAWLGQKGIVPVLLVSAACSLGFSWWFSKCVPVPIARISWHETAKKARRLLIVGLSFMWSGLLAAAVALATRALILRSYGTEGNGFYQSAWGISGMFAGFIISAMSTDFYPRLTAVAKDNAELNRLVNEQIEIGVLLALPGLLATMVFSPLVINIFYSAKFIAAVPLLPWFVLGITGRIVSWPIGMILLAKAETRWFAFTESIFWTIQITLTYLCIKWFGLVGAAVAFAIDNIIVVVGIGIVAQRISGFCCSAKCWRLLLITAPTLIGIFAMVIMAPRIVTLSAGSLVLLLSTWINIHAILQRLEAGHRIFTMIRRIPWIGPRMACRLVSPH